MSLVHDLARPDVLALEPYSSARSAGPRAEVALDANESPWPPLDDPELAGLERYPEPQPRVLVERLAELYGVSPPNLMVGRGSDDGIDALVRAFCAAGADAVLTCEPTYGVYGVAAAIQGAAQVRVPLRGERFELDPPSVVAAWRPGVKLVFLCSPNNPTGTSLAPEAVTSVCAALCDRALVVLDEAYVEVSETPSLVPELERYPNLVVLRTLSKAWALAGARIGSVVAAPDVVELLQRVRAPYPLAQPAVDAAVRVLTPVGRAARDTRVAALRRARDALVRDLSGLAEVETVWPSDANFLLVRLRDAQAALARARAAGVRLRDRGDLLGLERCVRISVGTEEENRRLLSALAGTREAVAS